MKGEVVDFEILRIQSELDKYQRTKSLPHIILDGAYSLSDIIKLYDKLSPKHQRIVDRLKKDYTQTVKTSIQHLQQTLKKEYSYTMKNLATEHSSFVFYGISQRHRAGLNPVRAMYYEAREVARRYNPINDYHQYLVGILCDKTFVSIILDALLKDIQRLEKIVKRYYIPIVTYTDSIPLELFHAKQTISDFRHYYDFFESINFCDIDD